MRVLREERVTTAAQAAWVAVAGIGVLVLVVHALWPFGGETGRMLVDDWLYNCLLVAAALTCLARAALVRRERVAWALMGIGLASWTVGDIYLSAAFGSSDPPVPSAADWLYLGFYPPAYVAIGLLVRSRLTAFSRELWLDGLSGVLAVGAVGAAVVFPAVIEATGGDRLSVAVNLAYPIGDGVLLALVAGVVAFTSRGPGDGWLLIASGFALFAVADAAYLYQVAADTYVEGRIVDVGWAAAVLLIAAAAWSASRRRGGLELDGMLSLLPQAAFALVALAVLVFDHFDRVTPASVVLATGALVAAIVRMILTARANHVLLVRSQEESLTDALTGLGNRHRLQHDLELLDDLDSTARALVLFDLDGFKNYNDSFGHPAGDALLARLGRRLRAFAGERGHAYRMGGDEFCLLAELDHADADRYAQEAAKTLDESGEGFRISGSYGVVRLPEESVHFADALGIADTRMYARKSGGRVPAALQTSKVLTVALAERDATLGDHVAGVSELAEAVARRLDLPEEQHAQLRIAGLVHDVGKMAIPEAILAKPGPLTSDERAYVERHTLVGERILQAAPSLAAVAHIVRSSHERWDGAGYPDGLTGPEIPLGARIVFVCDAFDAMIRERPYSPARTPAEALEELHRCAGTQFDPEIVEAFAAVLAERARAGEALLAGSADEPETVAT